VKIYKKENVFEEALNRIRLIFDEFPNIIVSMSGGKDSTVVYELVKMVARERDMLPIKVMWLDQECEFEATADYMRKVMHDPEVIPFWYQVPFRLLNATSATESWLNVWGEGEDWVREQDKISIKENVYGTDRFVDLMEKIVLKDHADKPTAAFTGVRGEESPTRFMGLTGAATYKWITWGNILNKSRNVYNFHPIYDWTFVDVWKAIHDNGWDYNKHYDEQYRYGVALKAMRVSNYHHETAVHALFMLQEIEPDTYAKATQRISGIDTAGKMGKQDWFVKELPFMFSNWLEYRDYLLENLIVDEKLKKSFKSTFESLEQRYAHEVNDNMYKTQINSILCNDVDMTKLKNWEARKQTNEQRERYLAHEAKFVG
jgi:predicted phosphoadenosine phosphosulfate sulfurtransferase